MGIVATSILEVSTLLDPRAAGPGSVGTLPWWGDIQIQGRVTGIRAHGAITFFDVQDLTGSMQVLAREKDLNLRFGDVVKVEGSPYVTKRKQLVIQLERYEVLARAKRDLPDLHHGVANPEARARQRELDLIANEESRRVFVTRSKIVAAIREYLNERGYLELETPVLQPGVGGASAKSFVTHHNALNRDLHLRIATELYLKRAIVGGFGNVYELGRFFRNEGISASHSPEFTMLEWFVSGVDYHGVMNVAEDMVAGVVRQVFGTTRISVGEGEIDFKPPWPRIPLRSLISAKTGLDIITATPADLVRVLDRDLGPKDDWAALVDEIQRKIVEPGLAPIKAGHSTQPIFVIDLPLAIWPLVQPHPEFPGLATAFDAFVGGMEILGGGTDITDPDEQRARFEEQRRRQGAGFIETHEPDEAFVRALEYGMPQASGCGMGIDRLTMLLTGAKNLRDTILFPTMREPSPNE